MQGAALREAYGTLLDAGGAPDASTAYLRSTHVARTVTSLQAVLSGLLPGLLEAQTRGEVPPIVVHSVEVRAQLAAA